MLIACPSCGVTCTVDPGSADTLTCPGCGLLMSSHDGTPLPQKVLSVKQALPVAVDESNAPLGATAIGPLVDEIDEAAPSETPILFRIGRYLLLGKIGEGGFGMVYRARDELLDREVALKVPRRERLSSAKSVAAFVQEARAVAKLRHPGIVGVYDVGQADDGSYYIAMELVNGQPLASLIKQRTLSFDETASLVAQIADAVHEAHKLGFVHRDLKPSNVLVDDDLHPHVADFGIAVSEDQQRSLEGDIAGTVPYMSPEQVAGEVHLMDGRSDIWSLGVILYQLLTGRRPFGGNSSTDLIQEILRRDPKPPRQINDRIPKQLEAICLKALQKRATNRYNTMQDLAEELRAWLSEPDSASSQVHSRTTLREPATTPAAPALQAPSRRRPVWIALGVGLFVIGTIGGAIELAGLLDRDKEDSKLVRIPLDPLPGVWYYLLEKPPLELQWRNAGGTGHYRYDADRRELWVDHNQTALFELSENQAESFHFEVTMHKTVYSDVAGVFYGYQEAEEGKTYMVTPDSKFKAQWVYHEVALKCAAQPGTKSRYHIVRRIGRVHERKPGLAEPEITYHGYKDVEVAPPKNFESKLEIVVDNGQLTRVLWNGVVVPGLNDKNCYFREPPPSARGKLGVINEIGATTFKEARFKVTRR